MYMNICLGIFKAIGLPFPKVGKVQTLIQWFGTEVINVGALSYSVKDVPAWWKDKDLGGKGSF